VIGLKSRSNSWNTCYHSFQNLLSANLLTKNIIIKIYRTLILPVLCGVKVLSVTLREEHSLRVCKSRVLMKILGPEGDEGIGDWRRLYNEELHDL
jgi:hypothetical protein